MPSNTTLRAFRLGIAIVALHVLDDNFVQPQPGTSAGDHLVSGLVPLAALALAAWAYPRLRGGRRGALALVVGAFGIVAGVEAVRYTIQVGASGDDYTGLLSIPAGIALLGLGAATLWRTRRTRRRPRAALPAPVAARRGRRRRRPARRRAAERELPLLAPGPRRRAGGQPRRRLRAGDVHDERRPRALRLVRAVPEPGRRDRVPWPQRPAGADADARPPRLRRAAVRPPRLGRERGRPARVRLGGREGHQGRDRVPEAPAGRRPGADRRPRAVGRRRADAPRRGRDRRPRGRRLGGRRLAVGRRGPRDARRRGSRCRSSRR